MITKEMAIGEIVQKYPETVEIFFKFGLHCVGCHAAQYESLEQGAEMHGIDIKELLKALNASIKKK
ncbi:MAG: DUF1858 domain-containing protein [Nanoarchaeota archaeon]|nr:DUF1858 domain-containing protein [Nanoarchaeota archaeon]MBU1445495.1 DUF1858 domain-containing protein [Nanoarchaeota archaeon]MBU2406579.1 DUF1858 domain-containing protein [Nanoarchaeota archaeon]MBU2420693.1 DUF1858 domain-containing protein [Nanoarchaeota archaeon]MBU2475666.1 DUF1858 domain-containing protein [Nanoarchaeota archaeon]